MIFTQKKFHVYDPENGAEEDAEEFESSYPEYAATEYAENYDMYSGDGYQDERTVLVREVGGEGPWLKFTVTAEVHIHYSAYGPE